MHNVMITGAAGFLGSHLMLYHLKRGDRVLGIDNFCSSLRMSEHLHEIRKEIRNRPHRGGGTFFEGDIAHGGIHGAIDAFTDDGHHSKFDLIYNFACPASPPTYQRIPVETMLTCVAGTAKILEVARRCGAVVVHASTSEVYGDPEMSPQVETYRGRVNSYGPRSCYDEGKRAAEALCYDYLNKHGVDARLVRIFNTYGPHMDPNDGRVISNFICQALRGERLTIYGDGQQTRSFCYVDDLIDGIVAMGALGQNPGGPINLGNPNEFTIMQLAAEVTKRLGGDDVVQRPLPTDDPTQRCPDITRAKKLLGWEPKVELAVGLDRTIEYFKGQVRSYSHGDDALERP